MNWLAISEIVAGLIFSGRLSWSAVAPDNLCEPYNQVVKKYRNRRAKPSEEEIIQIVQPAAYLTAIEAAKRSSKLPMNWPQMLEKAAAHSEIGDKLVKIGKQLIEGANPDLSPIYTALSSAEKGGRAWQSMSDIPPETNLFVKTGFSPFDDWMGGLPVGLSVFAGPPGTGKTTLALRLCECYAAQKRTAAYFSMEMTSRQLVSRALQVGVNKRSLGYIKVCDEQLSPSETVAMASRADAELIVVDFAELMLMGDSLVNESNVAAMYQTLAWAAKRMQIPIVLLAQLSRKYDGNLPSINMIRYSGMAEALASLIGLLYNPAQIYVNPDTANILPITPNKAYVIMGKSRYGFKMGSVGAIQLGWGDGGKGWENDQDSQWYSLAAAKVNT